MSLPISKINELVALVGDLRREVVQLRGELVQLEGRVVELESQRLVESLPDPEYEVVSAVGTSIASGSPQKPLVGSESGRQSELPYDRVRVAREIGQFLRRCLSGEPRGTSGRDRIAAPSSVYIVCQSYDKEVFDPPRIFFSWAAAKGLVIRRGSPGPSIFVGVPTVGEARIAVESAGCARPADLL